MAAIDQVTLKAASQGLRVLFALSLLLAGITPLIPIAPAHEPPETAADLPGWPASYEGRSLTELPLTARERDFTRDFPGRIARFSDGRREIILRYVTAPTRKLHPAGDCFRGIGYAITPLPMRRNSDGKPMACFRATRASHTISICEYIRSATGENWPDVSSWYWSALFNSSAAPWWSYVVAETTEPSQQETPTP